jgi:hypothetical protein
MHFNSAFAAIALLFTSLLHVSAAVAGTVPDVIGDGVADDTQAIQAAVDAGQGHLVFERGLYRITKTIEIDLDQVGWTSLSGNGVATFQMDSPGPAFRFVGTHGGTASPATVKPNVWQKQRTPMVDGVEIVGNHPQACGIEADGTMQLTLTRLVVRQTKHAVHLRNRNRNVTLSECHLYENRGIGVFLDRLNLHQINIANCHISYNAGGGIVARDSEIRNLQVGTCDIEGNMGDEDSQPTANILLDSRGSSIAEVAIVGCTIQHDHRAPGSANIRINGFSDVRPFTEERRTGNVTIANNVLSDVQTNIELQSVRAAAITGNTMWKGYALNVDATDCNQLTMSGNVYDRNPRYHYGDGPSAKLGVRLQACRNVTMTGEQYAGNVLHDASLTLKDCDAVNVNGCSFSGVESSGILLDGVTFSRIAGCLFTTTKPNANDITQVGENDVVVEGNRVRQMP